MHQSSDDKEGKERAYCNEEVRQDFQRVCRFAGQVAADEQAGCEVGAGPKRRTNRIEDQKINLRESFDAGHRSRDRIEAYDELGNNESLPRHQAQFG